MASSFFHGITTTIVDTGPRPIAVPSSSITGLVDTYTPGPDLVQPDVPVQITNAREAAQAFGQNSAITRAIKAIQERTSAVIVATGVAESDDADALTSSVIGGTTGAGMRTGLQSLLDAKSRFNVQPRLLIAPGFSARQPVATAMDALASKLRAVGIIDGPNTTDEAALAYARNFGSKRLYMVDPGVRTWDTNANAEADAPASAFVAGLFAYTDAQYGYWASPSNKEFVGITGTGRPIEFLDNDPACRANLLSRPASPPSFVTVATGCGATARCRQTRNGRSSRACARSTSSWMPRRPATNGPSIGASPKRTCTTSPKACRRSCATSATQAR